MTAPTEAPSWAGPIEPSHVRIANRAAAMRAQIAATQATQAEYAARIDAIDREDVTA